MLAACAANRDFASAPRLITAADGMSCTSHDGRQVMDATAGLWCVNAGHNLPLIVEAVQRQVATLDYLFSAPAGRRP